MRKAKLNIIILIKKEAKIDLIVRNEQEGKSVLKKSKCKMLVPLLQTH